MEVGGGRGEGGCKEKVVIIKYRKKEKRHMVLQSHSENRWVFRRLLNAATESASLNVKAFQILGAEMEKAL